MRPPLLQGLARLRHIAERMFDACDLLVVLVTFASNQHHILAAGLRRAGAGREASGEDWSRFY